MKKPSLLHPFHRQPRLALALVATVGALLISQSAHATILYWDTNGTTAGSGVTPSGTWSGTNWDATADGTGTAVTNASGTTNTAVFSAGSDATAYTVTVSGTLQTGGITVEEGTLTLAGASSGVLQVSTGGIVINNTVAGITTVDSTLNILLNGATNTWQNNSAQALIVNGGMSAGGSATKTLVLSGTGAGGTTFNGVLANGTQTLALTVQTTAGTTTLAGANSYSGLTTVGLTTASGPDSTLLITGSNSSAGATTISSGTLQLGSATNGGLASGVLTLGSTNNAATLQAVNADRTLSNNVSQTGNVTMSGSQSLTINGTYTNSAAALTLTNNITGSGKSLTLGNVFLRNSDTVTTMTFNGSGATAITGTIINNSAANTNAAGITYSGSGTLTLSGTNTYTGATTISGGTLSVATIGNGGVASNLGQASTSAANLVFNGGTLQYTGSTASTNRNFTINAGKTATFDVTTNNLTVSGASTATTGALNKIGNGTLTLAGANAHTGGTTVSLGTLVAANASALGSTTGDTTVSGGTLTSTVANVNLGNLTLSGGSLDANSTSIGSYTLANGKNFVFSAGTFNSTLVGALTSDRLIGSGAGTFSITGGALVLDVTNGGFGGYGVAYTLLNGFSSGTVSGLNISGYDTINWLAVLGSNGVLSFSAVAVPEPSTYAMVAGAGLLAFAFWRRRRTCA